MKRLVLLGGGHSHVEVIRRLGRNPPPGTRIELVSPDRHTAYSGMLPGFVSGHYRFADCHIDLHRLCHHARVDFRRATALAVDLRSRSVTLDDGASLAYDLLSIDTGSTPPVGAVPGATEYATPVRPVAGFLGALHGIVDDAARTGRAPRIAVVGGGAGGVELALALCYRLVRSCPAVPPLAENLRRALGSEPLLAYRPQPMALALISTGDKYAVASYGSLAFEGSWVWHWKDHIDRRFMRRYRTLSPNDDSDDALE